MDAKALRDVFGRFCTGVTAVCTLDGEGAKYGITVNSFSSLSLEPPLAMFAIIRDSDTLGPLQASGKFSINILAADQQDISNGLARKGGAEKMEGIATRSGVTGAPLLEGTLAYLDCELYELYEGGDHLIVVGAVKDAAAVADKPALLYYRSNYRNLDVAG